MPVWCCIDRDTQISLLSHLADRSTPYTWAHGAGAAAASGRGAKKQASPGRALVRRLGKAQVANVFTHLRKIAQHPLLVRCLFGDARVAEMARLAHARSAPSLHAYVTVYYCIYAVVCMLS